MVGPQVDRKAGQIEVGPDDRRAAHATQGRGHASSRGPSAGPTASSTAAANVGAGTKLRRTALGSDRISSVTSSSRSPGTDQSKASGSIRATAASGTWTVTPSDSAPGSKR